MEEVVVTKGMMARDDDDDSETWVYDSSLDHKGNVPLRASTGSWKAALFIIGIEFSERLSYFGLSTNLIMYLTKVLQEEVKVAAKSVNYWTGVTTLMPLIGGFLADAYLGRFSTVIASTIIYLAGLILLTMTQLVPSLKPNHSSSLHLHEVTFFTAMYLISVGTGGHKPSLESFGADQFDDNHSGERKKKMSYFNWWNSALCSGLILGVTVIVYVDDHVSWALADIVLTCMMALSLVVFIAGRRVYRYRRPGGSPLMPMVQVLVAAFAKRHLNVPSDVGELYEVPKLVKSRNQRLLCHTDQLSCLDKAAIIEHKDDEVAMAAEKQNPWRLSTVTQVEELKLILSMIPIWLASLPFGMCAAQAPTFFIKQASIMDRKLTDKFELPPATIYCLSAIAMIICVCIYEKLIVPYLRRTTGNERGISILKRIGIGMVVVTIAMVSAALVERKRLNNGGMLSVFWLAPQFMILGFGDGFALVGLQEYFYDQVPDRMRSSGIAFYLSVIGAANFLSGWLIIVVDHVTAKAGKVSWFAKDLNNSRLDLFYWLVAVINAVNLIWYVFLARRYSYKNEQQNRIGASDCCSSEEGNV